MIVVVSWFALLWGFVRCVDPLVQIDQGLVRGVKSEDGTYSMFMGIPYAQIDKQRPFSDPVAGPAFSAIFEANDDSAACPQREEFNNTIVGDFDCLIANVYVPLKASTTNRLPVMVWIHGGGFSIGFAGRYSHGPKFLIQHDVILVTINYRLGPYGFMCLGNEDVPGNAGLKDQLAALRWVKKNIAYFGGDEENITIFGESAGSLSVDYLILFHGNEDLFHKAILQSGTIFTLDATLPDPRNTIELAQYFDVSEGDLGDIIKSLSSIEPSEIIAAAEFLNLSFLPCIENALETVEPFMTKLPKDVLSSGKYKKVPIIAGFVETETLVSIISGLRNDPMFFENSDYTVDKLVTTNIESDSMTLKIITKLVKHFYLGDKSTHDNITDEIMNLSSDLRFGYTTERSMSYYLLESNPVYFYVFGFSSLRNYVKYRNNITEGGAGHADEISYLFEQSYYTEGVTNEEQAVIDYITTMWTNFAKYGNPTPEGSGLELWPTITRPAMWIGSDLKIVDRPFAERFAFLDLIYSVFDGYDLYYVQNE